MARRFSLLVLCLANGSDPDLSFLETIEEVSGYVYLSRNEVKTIPLKSLKIIRGEPGYRFINNVGSLVVTRNGRNLTHGLETIDLRNLIAIQRHNVIVKDNPLLCNFALTISWDGLFFDTTVQRYIPDRTNVTISQGGCNLMKTFASCDGRCPMFDGKGYCWGPGADLCQKMTKCDNDESSYCVDGPYSNQPCDDECLGGCENTPGNCRACKNVENDGKCVSQCPPQFIVNRADSRTIKNPDFKYHYIYSCIDACPAPFLKSKTYCVIECDLSREIPVNGTCQPCPPEGCPEHCTSMSIFNRSQLVIMDSKALRKFKSCVYYTGSLYISAESFIEKDRNRLVDDPILDLSLLWNLQNLQAIVGHVYMDFRAAPPELTNLTFLSGLRSLVMETRGSSSGPVLQIMNGRNVQMLGFRSLTHMDGAVSLVNMTKLCYLAAMQKMAPFRSRNVPTEEECVQRNAVCHSECLPQMGCWGPAANMCRHCCNLQAGEYCVSECTERPGFYELPDKGSTSRLLSQITSGSGSEGQSARCRTLPIGIAKEGPISEADVRPAELPVKQCGRCDEQCAETCYGPGPHQCQGPCKHYQHGDKCVSDCPRDTYRDTATKQCLACHETCTHTFIPSDTRMCSGPGDHFGLEGCTACWTVIKDSSTDRFKCLTNDCPSRHYTESHLTMDFVNKQHVAISTDSERVAGVKSETGGGGGGGMVRVCKPCHPYCDSCTANGTHISICHSCLHWWFRQECVIKCPPSETYTPYSNTSIPEEGTSVDKSLSNKTDMIIAGAAGSDDKTVPPSDTQVISLDALKPDGHTEAKPRLLSRDPSQKHCLLCHIECAQGCSGPGQDNCVKCKNYQIVINPETNQFNCSRSCPTDRPNIFHGMCLTSKQYAKMSGRLARELRDIIWISVSVGIIFIVLMAIIILWVYWKRRVKTEKNREKLFLNYTNLHTKRDSLLRNQSGVREPNMGRLEMISYDDLDYNPNNPPLGSGAFGVVYRGVWQLSAEALRRHECHGPQQFDVAIKEIHNDYPISPGLSSNASSAQGHLLDPMEEARRALARANIDELMQEAKVMASVEHMHCLPLIGVCLTRERHCMVTMYLELGSLDRYVKQYKMELNSLTLLTWSEQIASGMAYLEMRGIIHRDLAARNVLVQRPNLVQITDFGLAKMLENREQQSVVVRAGRVPIRWLAIETLQESIYSHKTDVWSYGVTLWEIFTYGCRPYEDVETKDIKDHVMKGGRLSQPEICTLDVYLVMLKCWMEDFESRPTFEELTRIFNKFCNAPGRYLYIQGDEYAMKNPIVSNYMNTNFSAESQEMRPLLRGAPDGAAETSKINGTLIRTGTGMTEVTTPTPGYLGRFPSNISTGFDFPQNEPQSQRTVTGIDGSVGEPDESDALLPIRRAPQPSIWNTRRHRNTATMSSEENQSTPSGAVPVPPAPLATSDDSTPWLADAPGSPIWRMVKRANSNSPPGSPSKPFPSSPGHSMLPPNQPSHSPFANKTPIGGQPTFSMDPSKDNSQSPSRTLVDAGGPLIQRPVPPSFGGMADYYLEPNANLFASGAPKPPDRTDLMRMPQTAPPLEEDYLMPRNSTQPLISAPPEAVGDFGISNMEYFMQPYMQPPHDVMDLSTSQQQKHPTNPSA